MKELIKLVSEEMERNKVREVKFLFERIFVPAMHEVFKSASPEKYKAMQGNCCRQTAILGCHFLSKLLPDFKWVAWEGDFDDILYGEPVRYRHAWIYGKSENFRYIVDMARTHKENLFIEVQGNRYPKDHPDYANMKEVNRKMLDWENLFNNVENEWYTSKPSYEVMKTIMDVIAGKLNEKNADSVQRFSLMD